MHRVYIVGFGHVVSLACTVHRVQIVYIVQIVHVVYSVYSV